jgi:hypothetical protein
VRNKNQLPTKLLAYLIDKVSKPGDFVVDLFLGSFSTAYVSSALGRRVGGIEMNKVSYQYGVKNWKRKALLHYEIPKLPFHPSKETILDVPTNFDLGGKSRVNCYILHTWWKLSLTKTQAIMQGIQKLLEPNACVFVVCNNDGIDAWLTPFQGYTCTNHIIWHHPNVTAPGSTDTYRHVLWFTTSNKWTFNREAFFSDESRNELGGSRNYADREDVWTINGPRSGKLAVDLIEKIVLYTTSKNDIVGYSSSCKEVSKVLQVHGRK